MISKMWSKVRVTGVHTDCLELIMTRDDGLKNHCGSIESYNTDDFREMVEDDVNS